MQACLAWAHETFRLLPESNEQTRDCCRHPINSACLGIGLLRLLRAWIENEAQAQRSLASYAADRAHRNKDARQVFLLSIIYRAFTWHRPGHDKMKILKQIIKIRKEDILSLANSSCCRSFFLLQEAEADGKLERGSKANSKARAFTPTSFASE